MHKLLAAIIKESKIILRDKEALLVLLAMPAVFVLIMSLALRDSFHEKAGVQFSVTIFDQDRGAVADAVRKVFAGNKHFVVSDKKPGAGFGAAELSREVVSGGAKFAIWIPREASAQARRQVRAQLARQQTAAAPVRVEIYSDPTLRRDHRNFVSALVAGALRQYEAELFVNEMIANIPGAPAPRTRTAIFAPISDRHAGGDELPIPTSVQQNAPAWTLLAMFFLVIPLSVTLIKEAQQGSLMRLRTMPVSSRILIAGKVAPYFAINQIQVGLILLEGKYLLPVFGGDALELGDSPAGIVLVSVAANLAAIGYGLLVAVFARSQEQATTFGAISVLILAAIGGIMVPKLVMPPLMQSLAEVSPLSWALEGFLDVFIRGGHVREVLPEVFKLLVFASICFAIAGWRLAKRRAPA